YGEHLGRAFQIWDDVLDVEGDPNVMGKASSDADNLKMTYPGVFGMDESKRLAREASEAAHTSLQNFQTEADALRQLARFVIERHK
ncbi:MAG: geranyl transferase, partial [Proteobacteria bacterium]